MEYKFGERIQVKLGVKKQNTDYSEAVGDFLYQPNGKEAEVELISNNNSRFRTRFKLTQIERFKEKPENSIKSNREVFCDYCGEEAQLVTGKQLYPHRPDLAGIMAWQCTPCDASVGCQKNSDEPLGRLANYKLKKMKQKAHAAFDPLWKDGHMTRTEAYSFLAEKLKLDRDECHIGKFDEDMCERVVNVIKAEGY